MTTFLIGVFVGVCVMGVIMANLDAKNMKEISEYHRKMYDEDTSKLMKAIEVLESGIKEQA